ncbi:MAG: hypothetical protein OXF46_11675, partial [Rhodobacteraceae bacterium]|nr:hypothetical protein [Paracoccaceae bacterium]
ALLVDALLAVYRSRSAGGVRIMRLPEDSEIVSVAKIDSSKIPDQEEDQFDEDGSEVSENPVE